jgi:hypothetical protein
MVDKKWIQVKWYGLPSIRYLFLILPSGQRVIVDHWSGFRPLQYIPFISKYQKFDAYFIPDDSDISDWESLLVSELDMVWGAAKTAGGNVLFKLLGGGTIAGVIIGSFELLEKPLATLLKFLHVPPFIFIVLFSFLLWWALNVWGKKSIKKRIPIEQFQFKEKIIRVKFKDWMMSITKYGYIIFIVFALSIAGTTYNNTIMIGLIILTFLAFFLNSGIPRTADLCIKYNEERENGKRE